MRHLVAWLSCCGVSLPFFSYGVLASQEARWELRIFGIALVAHSLLGLARLFDASRKKFPVLQKVDTATAWMLCFLFLALTTLESGLSGLEVVVAMLLVMAFRGRELVLGWATRRIVNRG